MASICAPTRPSSASSGPPSRKLSEKPISTSSTVNWPNSSAPRTRQRCWDLAVFRYQVQAGAYASQAEAEQQKAKLAMMGLEARLQAREVNGRTMYRVRLGPYAEREQADAVRVKLQDAGIESALVRVQP